MTTFDIPVSSLGVNAASDSLEGQDGNPNDTGSLSRSCGWFCHQSNIERALPSGPADQTRRIYRQSISTGVRLAKWKIQGQ